MAQYEEELPSLDEAISNLNYAFARVTQSTKAKEMLGSKSINGMSTKTGCPSLYDFQVDFAYAMNELTNGTDILYPYLMKRAQEVISRVHRLVFPQA